MTFEEYQEAAKATAIYPGAIVYPALGLCGESGEVAEKVKKVLRDKHGTFSSDDKAEIAKELGDVLWYVANLSRDLGICLGAVAEANVAKLRSRQERGVLTGSGDER